MLLYLCAVCLLLIGSAQTVNVNEEDYINEIPHTSSARSSVCIIENETENDECTQEEATEITTQESSTEQQEYILYYTESDVVDIAKVLLRECGGVPSRTEQACVAWCVLNRVDCYGSSIYEVLRAPNQFAFNELADVTDELYWLAKDVLTRWNDEKNGVINSGRVLPKDYIYFHGDGVHNYFRNAFDGNYEIWDYSLESPYKN